MSKLGDQPNIEMSKTGDQPNIEMSATGDRPNIVVILSDDQGAWAMGCAGNAEIHTPNLDRLAATGIRFENFFCTSPVCSPARASLMTGRIPSQHGVHDWIIEDHAKGHVVRYLEGQPTYVERLAESGYVCGLSGKWHVGDSMTPPPGFSHWYAHQSGGGPYYGAPMVRDGEAYKEPRYVTDAITDDALAFLDRQIEGVRADGEAGDADRARDGAREADGAGKGNGARDGANEADGGARDGVREADGARDGAGEGGQSRPFYLSVHYTAPHSPWIGHHPQEFIDLYEDCPFETCPQEAPHPWSIPNPPWGDDYRGNLKGYFAAVTAMDAQIGRILDKLEEAGLRERTLVVFMSDNGFSCGQHGFWGKGNGTFPQNMYDSSVKVPAIFSHPGAIPQGGVSEAMVSGYDFMPTLLAYAGIEHRDAEALPGMSFRPVLAGEPMQEREREHVVIYDEYGPVRMVRSKSWKYIHRYPYGPHELYDLVGDPGERVNLAADPRYADQLSAMKAQLEEWFVRYADPAVDGSREPVTGAGQIGLAGVAGRGKKAFADK